MTLQKTHDGVVLVPQPTSNPHDPLNWPHSRKLLILFVTCFAAFCGSCAPVSHQQAYVIMAMDTFDRPPIELSYSLSAAIAGMLAGPVLLAPIARIIGRSSVILWSLLATLGCQVWAARMTNADNYLSLVLSRMFAALFGSAPLVLGSGYIMDIFFLHERGKAFAVYELSFLFGVTAGPTFSGFIAEHVHWTICFWWTVAPLGLCIMVVLLFLRETSFDGDVSVKTTNRISAGFVNEMKVTFFPGKRVVPHSSMGDIIHRAVAPFLIGLAPVAILAGVFNVITFGFTTMILTLLPIFLQTPLTEGGYGFSPGRNAAFTFVQWFSLAASLLYATATSDKIPLWLSKRFGDGRWKPEYRVWNMMMPALIMPLGLGLFGAGLQYHLHYLVLALGVFLCNSTNVLTTPVLVNYVVECHLDYPVEVTVAMGIYRLSLGVGLNFFIMAWIKRTGFGWTFGMAAFFCVFAAMLLVILAWKGQTLRHITSLKSIAQSEEGMKIQSSRSDDVSSSDGASLERELGFTSEK